MQPAKCVVYLLRAPARGHHHKAYFDFAGSGKLARTLQEDGDHEWRPLEYRVLFGIVGGLGPMATVEFARLLVVRRVELFRAMAFPGNDDAQKRLEGARLACTVEWSADEVERVWAQTCGRVELHDQDHVPLLIAQGTTVPPRPPFILGASSVDPTPALVDCARGLVRAGATHLAMVCNTAHYFWPAVTRQVDATCVDMVELALVRALKLRQGDAALGLLATEALLKVKLYQDAAARHGVQCASPLDLADGKAQYDCVHWVIRAIKGGLDTPQSNLDGMAALLRVCLALHEEMGVETIVLGCTELPLVLNEESVRTWAPQLVSPAHVETLRRLRFVDPGVVLADHVLKLALLSRVPSA